MSPEAGAPALALLTALGTAWVSRDAAAISALFDGDDAETTYLDASGVDPWIGVDAIFKGAARRCESTAEIHFSIHAPTPRALAQDAASVFAIVDIGLKPPGGRMGASHVRVTLVAKRRGATWKIVHYAEAPKAPLLELESYYQALAADGLNAIPPRPRGSL